MIKIPPVVARQLLMAPLSFQQELAWRFADISTFSPPPLALRLNGALRIDCLQAALDEIVRRHDSLRTTFVSGHEYPQQVIHSTTPAEVQIHDLSGLPRSARDEGARQLLRREAVRPFDLVDGPLIRCGVMILEDQEYVLFFGIHHIVNDFWSMKTFHRELVQCYAAAKEGRPFGLKPLSVQYSDFAVWQREWLSGDVLESQVAYWQGYLRDTQPLRFPWDRSRPDRSVNAGLVAARILSAELSTAIRNTSKRNGATLFMTLLSAFMVLLHAFTGREDIVVSTTIANRNLPELEPLIGFLAHSVPLRISLHENPEIRQIINRSREACFDTYEHHHLPFWKLAELSSAESWSAYPPEISFALQAAPVSSSDFQGLTCTPFETTGVTLFEESQLIRTHWGQTWQVWECGDQLQFVVIYSSATFDCGTIQKMLGHLEAILRKMTGDTSWKLTEATQ